MRSYLHMNYKICNHLNASVAKPLKFLMLIFLLKIQLFGSISNWQTVSMPNVGTFQIPPSMEIQAGTYKEISDDIQRKIQIPFNEDRVVIQQKRLNEFNKKAFQSYTRILVETDYGQPGEYENIAIQIKASKVELQELDNIFRKEVEESFHKVNSTSTMTMKLLSWTPVSIVQINGVSMIKLRYTRSVNNAPAALVNLFVVQNNDRMHRITVSYRQVDANLWKNDLDKVIYTFKFNRK